MAKSMRKLQAVSTIIIDGVPLPAAPNPTINLVRFPGTQNLTVQCRVDPIPIPGVADPVPASRVWVNNFTSTLTTPLPTLPMMGMGTPLIAPILGTSPDSVNWTFASVPIAVGLAIGGFINPAPNTIAFWAEFVAEPISIIQRFQKDYSTLGTIFILFFEELKKGE